MKAKIEGLKQILYVLLPLFVFVLIYDMGAYLTRHVLGIIFRFWGNGAEMWMTNNAGSFQALCIIGGLTSAFICLFKTAVTDGFMTPKKEVWKKPVWQYVLILIGTVAVSYGMNYLFTVTGFIKSSESYQTTMQSQYDVALGIGLILYCIVSPLVEEVISRGFLYGRMRVYTPRVVAILVSSLLFGVYHGNLVQGLYGFFMGVIYTLVYEKYQNFYLAVMMHAITNMVAYFIQLNGFL